MTAGATGDIYEVPWTEPTNPNFLDNLQELIVGVAVIEVSDLVTALLQGKDSNESLNAKTHMAVARYDAMDDDEGQEALRTAVRHFVRMNAFLGQVVPFTSPELGRFVYCCAILPPRLKKHGGPDASLDLGCAAVLTHIGTEAGAAQNVSHTLGGRRTRPRFPRRLPRRPAPSDRVCLSELIERLNTKFGFEFTEVPTRRASRERRSQHRENFVIECPAGNDEMLRLFSTSPNSARPSLPRLEKKVYRKILDSSRNFSVTS